MVAPAEVEQPVGAEPEALLERKPALELAAAEQPVPGWELMAVRTQAGEPEPAEQVEQELGLERRLEVGPERRLELGPESAR